MKSRLHTGRLLLTAVALVAPSLAAARDGADPMRPPHAVARAAVAAAHEPRLTGLLMSGKRRGAIVNGLFVRAGDRIDGIEIVAVLDDGVRYRRGAQLHELHLSGPALQVRRPATVITEDSSGAEP